MDVLANQRSMDNSKVNDSTQLRRYQLLRYRDVTRLCDVMETVVPIHGTGNFPTLDIEPFRLVQFVRDRLHSIGIKVRDIRLNGSAATHVLSEDVAHAYKDLDLIFAIDFPSSSNSHEFVRREHKAIKKSTVGSSGRDASSSPPRPNSLPVVVVNNTTQLLPDKDISDDTLSVDDSGYTSSGSSGPSVPPSPCSFVPAFTVKSRRKTFRSRTRSFESISSTSSVSSFRPPEEDLSFTTVHSTWQGIKEATIDVLLEFLPPRVNRTNMSRVVLGDAYVQKMVKVGTSDKWSLISLNNNSGRNLELKFVQSMKRQYEFSVDSFQILLDTYLAYKEGVSQCSSAITMTENFFPTVLAESVYGDFAASLRHLRLRRICTHKPEEIRGGGLLRYCNLLARDFRPGDEDDGNSDILRLEQHMCSRFFIDFNDIDRQQQKLLSYLDNHFHGEEELKFQYLLILRRVVETSTVCLMQHERTMVLELITTLARQSLANNLATDMPNGVMKSHLTQQAYNISNPAYVITSPRANNRQQLTLSNTPCSPSPCNCHRTSLSNSVFTSSGPRSTPNDTAASSRSPTPTFLPSDPPHFTPQSQNAFRSDCPFANQAYSWLCCCHLAPQNPLHPSYSSACRTHKSPTVVRPIYYNSEKMTCFYQPAR